MTTAWSFPTRVLFGEGTVAQAGPEASALGAQRALIVTDPGVANAGLAGEVQRALERAGVASEIFQELSTNPTEAEVLTGTEAFARAQADLVGRGDDLDPAVASELVRRDDLANLVVENLGGRAGHRAETRVDEPP